MRLEATPPKHLPFQFNEGASSSSNRIAIIATAIIASLISFLLLPFEGALTATLGIGTLASLCSCRGSPEPQPRSIVYTPPPRVYASPASPRAPTFHRMTPPPFLPVKQPGRRGIPGAGPQQHARTRGVRRDTRPHAPLGR